MDDVYVEMGEKFPNSPLTDVYGIHGTDPSALGTQVEGSAKRTQKVLSSKPLLVISRQ